MERDWQMCTLRGHSDMVRSVAFSPDGTRVVSGSDDKLVKIWSSETGAEVCSP
jgi:WD40 repeat protein